LVRFNLLLDIISIIRIYY